MWQLGLPGGAAGRQRGDGHQDGGLDGCQLQLTHVAFVPLFSSAAALLAGHCELTDMGIGVYLEAARRRYEQAAGVYKTAVAAVGAFGVVAHQIPLLSTKPWGPYVLILLPLSATVTFAFAVVRSRSEILRHRLAAELVDRLHVRWFSKEHDVVDDDHRVTLYAAYPNAHAPKVWKCIARSGDHGGRLGCDWPHPERDDQTSGPVVFVARSGSSLNVTGIPTDERKSAEVNKQYRRAVRMTEACAKQRTWPGASIHARGFRARNGTIPAVILVERESGEPVCSTAHSECTMQHHEQVLAAMKKQLIEAGADENLCAAMRTDSYNPMMVELDLAAAVAAALWEGVT